MASIYELNKDYAELSAMLEAAETPEEIEAIQNTLEMLDLSIEEKIENTAKYMVNVEADIQGIKAEIDRLNKIKKSKESTIETLKNNIEYSMKQKGIEKLEVGTFKAGYRKSESVEVDDLKSIPSDYIKTEIKPDKTAIKKALKAGEEISGVHIQTNMNFYIK
nr:MAG TPA: resistance protein [Caudoviricetes sp.]